MSFVNNLKQTAIPAAIFLGLSLPQVSGQVNSWSGTSAGSYPAGCPSPQARLLQTVAFFAVTYLVAKYYKKGTDNKQMIRYALYGALMYFILSSGELYTLTDSLVGSVVGNVNMIQAPGCPSLTGVLVHTAVFALILAGMGSLK